MDDIDIRLLELLQSDGRMTISELSIELLLSRPSVSERVSRLHERGVISGFTARVNHKAIGRNVAVFLQVGELKVACKRFEEMVKTEKAIIECHRITGAFSYLIKAYVTGVEELETLVDKIIPYGSVNTSLVLSSPVPHRTLLPSDD